MCDVTHSFMYAHSRGNDVNMLARCDSVPRCICVGYVSLSFWVSCAKEPYLSATLSQQRKCILWTEKVWFMEPPIVAMCRMCHTDMCHTDMCHRDVSHRYVSHRYCHTDICHTDMCHTDVCRTDICHTNLIHLFVCVTQIRVTQMCVTQMWVTQICVAQLERDNVVYWKTKRKIKNDLQCRTDICCTDIYHTNLFHLFVCVTSHTYLCDASLCHASYMYLSHVSHSWVSCISILSFGHSSCVLPPHLLQQRSSAWWRIDSCTPALLITTAGLKTTPCALVLTRRFNAQQKSLQLNATPWSTLFTVTEKVNCSAPGLQ